MLTNVPGPQSRLYFAGGEIREMMFWVPQNGSIGLGISILSYNGKIFFGLISDRKLVPQPDEIVEKFRPEMEKLLMLSLLLPCDDRLEGEAAERFLTRALAELNDAGPSS